MIWLFGTSTMAQAYGKVLREQNVEFMAFGRNEERALSFAKEFGVSTETSNLEEYLKNHPDNVAPRAIVAVNVEQLYPVTRILLEFGVSEILLEKPGSLTEEEFNTLSSLAHQKGARVLIAYNRRFYASTLEAQRRILEDGGVSSFNFEFTEWGHAIEKLNKSKATLDHWLLGNSTHVIDLAFYLGGQPQQMKCFSSGANNLSWHSQASSFSGAGVSEKGALFSYCANWAAPGRWSVEILTAKNRYYLKPMESLQVQKLGSVLVELLPLSDELDKQFKPGIFRQVHAFLQGDYTSFKSIHDQAKDFILYQLILEGN